MLKNKVIKLKVGGDSKHKSSISESGLSCCCAFVAECWKGWGKNDEMSIYAESKEEEFFIYAFKEVAEAQFSY